MSPRYHQHQRENFCVTTKSPVSPSMRGHRIALIPKYEEEDDEEDDQGLLDLSVKRSASHLKASPISHVKADKPVSRKPLVSPGSLLRNSVSTFVVGAEDLSPGARKRASPLQTPEQQPIRKCMSTGKLNKSQVNNLE